MPSAPLASPPPDLRRDDLARRFRTLPIEVDVSFAASAGEVRTREGPVRHQAGAAIVTGTEGERWPVERAQFARTYVPVSAGAAGSPGRYRKREVAVLARRVEAGFEVNGGQHGDILRAEPGDWLVQYAPGQHGIVSAAHFEHGYAPLDSRLGKWSTPVLHTAASAFRAVRSLLILKDFVAHHERPQRAPEEAAAHFTPADFDRLDRRATLLGDAYRGAGVLVTLLGTAVILMALIPEAFKLDGPDKQFATVLKLVAMLVLAVVFAWMLLGGLRERWIRARLLAERMRYLNLERELEELPLSRSPADVEFTRQKLFRILDGDDGQIRYHRKKAREYESIEWHIERIGWWAFAGAALGAVASTLLAFSGLKAPLLLMLTAALPVAIGGLHGMSAFLKLSQLVAEHQRMATELEGLGQLIAQTKTSADQVPQFVTLGRRVLTLLRSGDGVWTRIAGETKPKPG